MVFFCDNQIFNISILLFLLLKKFKKDGVIRLKNNGIQLSGVRAFNNNKYFYDYRTVSVDRLPELQADIDKLEKAARISPNKVFRGYISSFVFQKPEDFSNAKSIIVLALFAPPISLNFHYQGKVRKIWLPGNYTLSDLSEKDLEEEILNKIIREKGFSIKRTRDKHLKLLAVRSGLGKYGRNNICYVGEMGSFVNLMAFFTDYKFKEYNWEPIEMMDSCYSCNICISECPLQVIPKSNNFIVDIESCITLFNEIPGIIPERFPKTIHNALIGCMICQRKCPGNRKSIHLVEYREDIPEDVVQTILEKDLVKAIEIDLIQKIPIYFFYPQITLERLDLLKRNLELVLTQKE